MSGLCFCFSRGSSTEKLSSVIPSSSTVTTKLPFQSSEHSASSKSLSPLLVELFTSQGCSSCPSADLIISNLGQQRGEKDERGESEKEREIDRKREGQDGGGKNRDREDSRSNESDQISKLLPVIALAYHVDYWDYLGWKDPFACNRWSGRHRSYGEALQQDSIYTPEVVVQGRLHCIGSNAELVSSLIKSAPRFPALDIRVSFSRPNPSELEVSLSVISLRVKVEGNVDAMVAIFENGRVTDCCKGENRGRVLTNDRIVRSLEKVCTLQAPVTKKPTRGQANMKLWEGYTKAKCGMVVFLQNPSSMEVVGAQLLELPNDA